MAPVRPSGYHRRAAVLGPWQTGAGHQRNRDPQSTHHHQAADSDPRHYFLSFQAHPWRRLRPAPIAPVTGPWTRGIGPIHKKRTRSYVSKRPDLWLFPPARLAADAQCLGSCRFAGQTRNAWGRIIFELECRALEPGGACLIPPMAHSIWSRRAAGWISI